MSTNVKHKRKWIIVAVVFALLLLLLPGIIGHMVRSQLDAQFASLEQAPEWRKGWWHSTLQNNSTSGIAVDLAFTHGLLWLNPAGAGITRFQGKVDTPAISNLPLSGKVGLNGRYQVIQGIPNDFLLEATGLWSISQTDDDAQLLLQGSLGNPALDTTAQLPSGMLNLGIWQLDWANLMTEVLLTQPADPLLDGSMAIQADQLRWLPAGSEALDQAVEQLNFNLQWPADHPIQLSIDAGQLKLAGQPEQTGPLQLAAEAVSIDRIALLQWLNAQQQNPQSPGALLALAGLLAAQPEFKLEQFNLTTPHGDIQLQASVKLKPNQREARVNGNMPEQAAQWLAKALLVDSRAAAEQVESLVNNGLLNRVGDQLVVDLVVNL